MMLDRVISGEGRGKRRLWAACGECGEAEPTLRCRDQDCLGGQMFCRRCILLRHAALPLHWVEEWDGRKFTRRGLKEIGLRVQLGHAPLEAGPGLPGHNRGAICAFRTTANKDFVVLHTNGIHNVAVDYCGCGRSEEARDQLLDACWWPATPMDPQTCCTFTLLRHFHTLNTLGKVSGYDYYRSLELLTDNTGNVKLPDRRRPFMRCAREWRNIQLFKRAGRAHDPGGIEGTEDGGLSLFCHACPQPQINLPENWRDEPASTAFKYFLHLGQDANFRLRGRLVSSDAKDPTLGQGLAYFVNKIPYTEHIKNYVNQDEISSCSGFAAMFLANLKRVKGLRTSGVGGVTCTRHNMWRANGMGDLQKGERYCNMDWVLASSMRNCEILYVIFTYDIACQYYKNFWDRMRKLPQYLHLNIPPSNLFFYVPNFHLPPHKDDCHGPFSLHFAPGVGMSNGEGIEQNWENSNGAASQTKQMGPGSRQDTLDDILGAHNYRKTLALRRILLKRMIEALKEGVKHRRALDAFTAGLESAEEGLTARWEKEEREWQQDKSKPCPYRVIRKGTSLIFKWRRLTSISGKTMKDIELELAKEEFEVTASNVQVVHESSRSMFVVMGLEIEEAQRVLDFDVRAKKAATTYQELEFQKRRNELKRKIDRFRTLQDIYMPALRDELQPEQAALLKTNAKKEVESIKLFLPSALSSNKRANACAPGVSDIEERLRLGEATDALETLRDGLRMRTVTNCFKIENITGQRSNTRAQGIQHQIDVKIHSAKAYAALVGPGPWANLLQVLGDEDVRALNERALTTEEKAEEERMRDGGLLNELASGGVAAAGVVVTGEGRRTLSWIWYTGAAGGMGEGEQSAAANEALRAEWCKGMARAARWREEIILLEEEMRRSITSAEYMAGKWEERARWRAAAEVDAGGALAAELAEGLAGYAYEHASTARVRVGVLRAAWAEVREKAKIVLDGLDSGNLVDVTVATRVETDENESGDHGMYEELHD
ncbi:hypothetical protein B0H15DRAFT_925610 [Mycena belliarum]|uniref:CxC2-like cysteine cluster KDZ transposase-associated domain-containing protein n=1 Tax=Mycena belliarum TaxID=1033014 RepID=A0AAD6TQ52_9AGAR|nr:hypothetical protein B0H15DRAFT_925610 [Mycena belliae]